MTKGKKNGDSIVTCCCNMCCNCCWCCICRCTIAGIPPGSSPFSCPGGTFTCAVGLLPPSASFQFEFDTNSSGKLSSKLNTRLETTSEEKKIFFSINISSNYFI